MWSFWKTQAFCVLTLTVSGAGGGGAAFAATQSAPHLTPDSVAAEFQTALRAMAWPAAARWMHSEALRRFRNVIDVMVEVDESETALQVLFGGMSEADYRSLSSNDVFVRAMRWMSDAMPGLIHALVDRKVEILGAVEELPDHAYVVYRNQDQLSGAVPEIRVMTLKQSGNGWRVLETEELDLIREAVKGVLRRSESQPPDR